MNSFPSKSKSQHDLTNSNPERKKQSREFGLGFLTNIILNLIIGALFYLVFADILYVNIKHPTFLRILYILILALPWVVNVVIIIVALVKHRSTFVLGFLAPYAIAFILAMIAGIVFVISCFVNVNAL